MFMRSLLTGAALLSLVAVPAFAANQSPSQPSRAVSVAKPVAATAAKPAPATETAKATAPSAGKAVAKTAAHQHRVASHKMHRRHKLVTKSVKTGTQTAKIETPISKTGSGLPKVGK